MSTITNLIVHSKIRTLSVTSGLLFVMAGGAVTSMPAIAQDSQGYTGNIIGGVAGALLGSRIGSGNGRTAAAALGGVLGSVVGGNVQAGMRQQPYESQPYQSQPYQTQVYQTQSYQTQIYRPVETRSYSYEAYPEQPQYDYVYPQSRVVQYEQPVYRQQTVHVYQQPDTVPERNYTGPIVGGVAGALLASTVGKGNGKTAATALGGVVGAIVGDRIQNMPYQSQQRYIHPQTQPQRHAVQPYQQYPQTVNRVQYYTDGYTQRQYATPDPY